MKPLSDFEASSVEEIITFGLGRETREILIPDETQKRSMENKSTEVLFAAQDDGMQNFLACTKNEKTSDCYGAMIDVLGPQRVGDTTFSGNFGEAGNRIIHVDATFTHEGLRGAGLAERRLLTINEYCKSRFGIPLSSSSSPGSSAERLWEGLRQRDLVDVQELEFGRKRYTFK